jgi:hypothetical protein
MIIHVIAFSNQLSDKDGARAHWAKLAKEGSLIMWVMKGRKYLGPVRDGVFYDLRKKKD